MPQLGESVAEGTIGKWLKQPGDHVDKYEPLLEVITDKVNAEVPSPFEGILREILVEEGATVPNNAEIAVIETADEAGGAKATTSPAPAAGPGAARKESAAAGPGTGRPLRGRGGGGGGERPPLPRARAAARVAPEKEPAEWGPDRGVELEAGDPAAAAGGANGPAGSDERRADERPERAAAAAGAGAPSATAP